MDKSKRNSRGYVVWTDEMDEVLLNVFVDRYNKGDCAQNGWKPPVYTEAVKNVHEKCSIDIIKDNIISRSKTFDKHYAIISKMLSRSGFGWDWDKNKISVDSDDVWDNYVKDNFFLDNKEAGCYRYRVVKFWDQISLVYSKDHATGEGARTAAESAAEMVSEDVSNSAATSSAQTGEEHKKKRYRSDDSMASMLGEKLDNFTTAFLQDESAQASKVTRPKDILTALYAIPDLEEDDLLAVYDILVSNERKFQSLMALPDGFKNRWVLKQVKQ